MSGFKIFLCNTKTNLQNPTPGSISNLCFPIPFQTYGRHKSNIMKNSWYLWKVTVNLSASVKAKATEVLLFYIRSELLTTLLSKQEDSLSVEFSKGKSFMEQLISNCLFCCLNLLFIYFSNKDDVKLLARFSNMVVDSLAVRHFWIASNENSKDFS